MIILKTGRGKEKNNLSKYNKKDTTCFVDYYIKAKLFLKEIDRQKKSKWGELDRYDIVMIFLIITVSICTLASVILLIMLFMSFKI